jgi:hypothetical protein
VETASLRRTDPGLGPNDMGLAGLVDSALQTLQLSLPGKVLAVYAERQFDELAIVQISPVAAPPPSDGYSLAFRFASWLTALVEPGILSVPTFLSPWLPLVKALVVPLLVEGQHRGAIVVEIAGLGRRDVAQIEGLASRISETLAEFERSSPQGVQSARDRFAHSVLRIKTLT